jgi:hypothetical protein|tara:strand:+ start:3100 stop:3225 length:126 start_codon:yes stop_codon:yes gene_type:complete
MHDYEIYKQKDYEVAKGVIAKSYWRVPTYKRPKNIQKQANR